MLSSVRKKIKSAPSQYISAGIILVGLAAIVAIAFIATPQSHRQLRSPQGEVFKLAVADTDALRQKGLSHKKVLGITEGMVFVYDQPGKRCMWMKDMDFPIDMLWLDAAKRVVAIETHVLPSSFPRTFCNDNSQYVIELYSGKAASLVVGQQLSF